jgi:hypothetical protein
MSVLSLVYPMLALVLLTGGVLIVLFRSRVRMVREGLAPVSYFRVFQGSPEPEFAAKPARHFTNLFEAPTLFYVGCLAAMVAGVTGPAVLALAWGYVAMRYAHAFIHLGGNRPVSPARVLRGVAAADSALGLCRSLCGSASLTAV